MSFLLPIRLKDGFGVPGESDFFLMRISLRSPIFLKAVRRSGVKRKELF